VLEKLDSLIENFKLKETEMKKLEKKKEMMEDIDEKLDDLESDLSDINDDIDSEISDNIETFNALTGQINLMKAYDKFNSLKNELPSLPQEAFEALKFEKKKSKDLEFGFVKTDKGIYYRHWRAKRYTKMTLENIECNTDGRKKWLNMLFDFCDNGKEMLDLISIRKEIEKTIPDLNYKFKKDYIKIGKLTFYYDFDGGDICFGCNNQSKLESLLNLEENDTIDTHNICMLYFRQFNKFGIVSSALKKEENKINEMISTLEKIKSDMMEKYPILVVNRI
jgi:DNA repair exonuclease SbcCD ATPase subunit